MLERDFEALPELAALVADMQEEIASLKHRLHCAGIT
jgi:chaperone modulatory protein CbpM